MCRSEIDHTTRRLRSSDAPARHESVATLQLFVGHRPKQSLCHTTVTIAIDDVPRTGTWGAQEFHVSPGEHRIAVCFRYCRGERGRAERTVVVTPGETVRLEYETPSFMFGMRGRLDALRDRD